MYTSKYLVTEMRMMLMEASRDREDRSKPRNQPQTLAIGCELACQVTAPLQWESRGMNILRKTLGGCTGKLTPIQILKNRNAVARRYGREARPCIQVEVKYIHKDQRIP